MSEDVQIGSFVVDDLLGSGGMARVWAGTHRGDDHPVAIKVLSARRARKPRNVREFLREIRAVARLNHRNIIRIYDTGVVPAQVERRMDGEVVSGSPYLVMERATASLRHIAGDHLDWTITKGLLSQILDALAHSHARGLVHRDLKPDNVLFIDGPEGPQLKLSDFGLVYSTESDTQRSREMISGTPRYMAPEQIQGRLRDQGPWTDVYALGCLVYWLVGGEPPYSAEDSEEIYESHLTAARPVFQPLFEVPEGFVDWSRRLIARDPQQRFRRCADAAAALEEMCGISLIEDTDSSGVAEVTVEMDTGDEIALASTAQLETLISPPVDSVEPDDVGGDIRGREGVSLPEDWRRESTNSAVSLTGVGLELYELRELPFVGRVDERDRLWEMLENTLHQKRCHTAVLSGPAGVGKTRLAEWIAERAHEVGAFQVLRARHASGVESDDALPAMFSRFLRCNGLGLHEIVDRIDRLRQDCGEEFDRRDALMTATLLAPVADPNHDGGIPKQFQESGSRYGVWQRLLRVIARRRPVLLVVDDVQWGEETLSFIESLLNSQYKLPIAAIGTLRSDLVEDDWRTEERFSELVDRERVQRLSVGPLKRAEHVELVKRLLGLKPDLAEEVVDRTTGNPLFAIQLVGDWISRGLLKVGEEGFYLSNPDEATLPEGIHQLLVERIKTMTGATDFSSPDDELVALEIAAVLGRDVDEREWRRACYLAGSTVGESLVDELVERDLARRMSDSWAFGHGAVREVLQKVAAEHGRLARHHSRCARMLADLYSSDSERIEARRGRSLYLAESYEQALEPLVKGVHYYRRTGQFDRAWELLRFRDKAVEQLGCPEDDRRVLRGDIVRVHLLLQGQQIEEGQKVLADLERTCRRSEFPVHLADTLLLKALFARDRGQMDEGLEAASEALGIYEQHRHRRDAARCRLYMSELYRWRGDLEDALQSVRRARPVFDDLDELYDHARCLRTVGYIYGDTGNYQKAYRLVEKARKKLEELGATGEVAECWNTIGELHRKKGNPEEAVSYYRRAMEEDKRTGLSGEIAYQINMGLSLLEQRSFRKAAEYFQQVRQVAADRQRTGLLAACEVGLLSNVIVAEDWEAFEARLHSARRNLGNSTIVDRDVAVPLEIAADLARSKQRVDEAQILYKMAIEQWRELGDETRVEKLERRLQKLETDSPSIT